MYQVDELLILKKPHACGNNAFKVVRVGADIKIQCELCARFINLTRDELKKRVKEKRTENK